MATRFGTRCNVCGGTSLTPLVSLPSVPVLCNQLLREADAARAVDRAAIDLSGCDACGHVFNTAFDPGRIVYGEAYGNSLMGSPRYRAYTETLVDDMMTAHGLRGGTVVEIGCGSGEFLALLLQKGAGAAVGFDPSRAASPEDAGPMRVVGTPFDAAEAPRADLVCSRHVLEHLPAPGAILDEVREAYGATPPRLVFIEVPDGTYTLDNLGIWDLIYEHVSYFTGRLWR